MFEQLKEKWLRASWELELALFEGDETVISAAIAKKHAAGEFMRFAIQGCAS